jgi:hypothetical protein
MAGPLGALNYLAFAGRSFAGGGGTAATTAAAGGLGATLGPGMLAARTWFRCSAVFWRRQANSQAQQTTAARPVYSVSSY